MNRCKLYNSVSQHKRMDEATYARVIKYETKLYKNFLKEEKRKENETFKRMQREKEARRLQAREKRQTTANILEVIDENSELKLKNDRTNVKKQEKHNKYRQIVDENSDSKLKNDNTDVKKPSSRLANFFSNIFRRKNKASKERKTSDA